MTYFFESPEVKRNTHTNILIQDFALDDLQISILLEKERDGTFGQLGRFRPATGEYFIGDTEESDDGTKVRNSDDFTSQ